MEKSRPDFIFAMKAPHADGTKRPLETIQPLADSLKITVDDSIKNSHINDLVQKLLTAPELNGKVVLICWNREGPPIFAAGLGVVDIPHWPSPTFDRFWVFDFDDKGLTQFRDLPENLLPGDSVN